MSDNANTPDDGGLSHVLANRYGVERELRSLGEADGDGRVSDTAVTRRLYLIDASDGNYADAVLACARQGHRERAEEALRLGPDDTPPAA